MAKVQPKKPAKGKVSKRPPTKAKGKAALAKKKTAAKPKVIDPIELDSDFEELAAEIKPGQKYPTPPVGDSSRAFYETTHQEFGDDNEMALKWLFERGLFTHEKQEKLLKTKFKKK